MFADAGADLVITGRDAAGLEATRQAVEKKGRRCLSVEADLRSKSFPRLQMLLLVALTGAFGLLASFSMLRLGLDSMALRYPLALAAAYGFFLVLIWLWLRPEPG